LLVLLHDRAIPTIVEVHVTEEGNAPSGKATEVKVRVTKSPSAKFGDVDSSFILS
jgi:hypothetical protein